MNCSPIYTLLNHIPPPTHSSYQLAQIISIKEKNTNIPSYNKFMYSHINQKRKKGNLSNGDHAEFL